MGLPGPGAGEAPPRPRAAAELLDHGPPSGRPAHRLDAGGVGFARCGPTSPRSFGLARRAAN